MSDKLKAWAKLVEQNPINDDQLELAKDVKTLLAKLDEYAKQALEDESTIDKLIGDNNKLREALNVKVQTRED